MRSRLAAYTAAVTIAWASGTAIASGQGSSSATKPKTKGNEITVIGCVEPETDYRARLDAKKGGPLASGVGQSNEFVLSSSKPAPANGSTRTREEAVATAGLSGDYLLTGKPENELAKAINREVEVVGVVEEFRANKNAKEDRDRLPRLVISTWHPVGDFCPGTRK
jgi:hypothetical protein